MEDDDLGPIDIPPGHIERLARLFGAGRPPKPFEIDKMNLLVMPGAVPVPDVEHSERIDWREVRVAIDLDEGRYHHLLLDSTAVGRPDRELHGCKVFEAVIGQLLTRLYDAVWPGRDRDVLQFPDTMRVEWIYSDPRTGAAVLSFHANAEGQQLIRSMSSHEKVALLQAWRCIAQSQQAKRGAGERTAPAPAPASCGYQGHEFGARYPDSICIEGYLWDADSGDGDGLTSGGDIACPGCNMAERVDQLRQEIQGIVDADTPQAAAWEHQVRQLIAIDAKAALEALEAMPRHVFWSYADRPGDRRSGEMVLKEARTWPWPVPHLSAHQNMRLMRATANPPGDDPERPSQD